MVTWKLEYRSCPLILHRITPHYNLFIEIPRINQHTWNSSQLPIHAILFLLVLAMKRKGTNTY